MLNEGVKELKVFFYNLILDLSERGIVLDRLTFTTNGSVSSPGILWLLELELPDLSQGFSVSTLLHTLIDFFSAPPSPSPSPSSVFVLTFSFLGNLNCWRLNLPDAK